MRNPGVATPTLQYRRPFRAWTQRLRSATHTLRHHYWDSFWYLSELGIQESVQHDDLHMANLFDDRGRFRVVDSGDSSIAHPFFSLVVTFRFLEEFNHLAPNDPWFHRLRDAYIWSRGGVDWKRLSKSRYGSAGLRMQSHGLGSGMHFHPRRGPISIECSRSLCGGRSLRRATGPVARTRSVVGFAPSESGMRFVAIRNQYPEGCPSAVTWLTARSNERVKAAAD